MKRKEPIELKRLPKGWTILWNPSPEDIKKTRAPFKAAKVNRDWWQEMKLPIYKNTDWEVEIIERERKLREKIEATLRKHGKANEKGLKLVQKAIQRQKDWAHKYISFFGSHDRAVDFELFHDRLKELEKTLGFGQQYQWEQIFELQNSLNSRGQDITIGRRTPDNEPKEITPRPNEVDPDKEGREDSKPETQTSKGLSEKFYEWLRKQERSKGNLFLLACRVSDFDVKGEKENLGNKEFNNKYSKKIGLQLNEISACVNKAKFKVSSGEELLDTLNRTGIDRVKTLLRTLKSEAPLDNDSKSKIDELLKLIEY
jgi:hypothetical protein